MEEWAAGSGQWAVGSGQLREKNGEEKKCLIEE
jgi:hypothetical protein